MYFKVKSLKKENMRGKRMLMYFSPSFHLEILYFHRYYPLTFDTLQQLPSTLKTTDHFQMQEREKWLVQQLKRLSRGKRVSRNGERQKEDWWRRRRWVAKTSFWQMLVCHLTSRVVSEEVNRSWTFPSPFEFFLSISLDFIPLDYTFLHKTRLHFKVRKYFA